MRLGALVGSVVIALWGAALVASCSSSDDSGSGGAPDASGPTFGASACYACLTPACASQESACLLDPECAAYLDCARQCGVSGNGSVDPACQSACPTPASAGGVSARQALDACWSSAPCAACGNALDAGSDSSAAHAILNQDCAPSTQTDPCFKCLYEECCDTLAGILTGGAASEIFDCIAPCNDKACNASCFEQYPDQVAGYGANVACSLLLCDDACSTPTAFSTCLAENCAEPIAECFTKAECYKAFACWEGADKHPCIDQYPLADPEFDVLVTCFVACN